MNRNFLNLLTGIVLSLCCSITALPKPSPQPESEPVIIQTETVAEQSDTIRTELVKSIDNYISKNFPKSQLTGAALLSSCEEHDFDICFAMAQAQIESGFGTVGVGARCNSPWNVGAHDGRSSTHMNKLGLAYKHPDHSIEPYIELVKTKYLGTKRTVHDLMKNYVSLSGHRYAQATEYEQALRSTYNKIRRSTNIYLLQSQL